MEILLTFISFILLIGLISIPILLAWRVNKLNVQFKFVIYLVIGLTVTAVITFTFAWWADKSNRILLAHYGYDIYGMNETEFYGHVLPENLERVKAIELNVMGVGWPLKAILTYVFYVPYLLIVYGIMYLIGKIRQKNYSKE